MDEHNVHWTLSCVLDGSASSLAAHGTWADSRSRSCGRHKRRRARALVYALLSGVRETFGPRVSDAAYRSARAIRRDSTHA
jgi:hypothetical protein